MYILEAFKTKKERLTPYVKHALIHNVYLLFANRLHYL